MPILPPPMPARLLPLKWTVDNAAEFTHALLPPSVRVAGRQQGERSGSMDSGDLLAASTVSTASTSSAASVTLQEAHAASVAAVGLSEALVLTRQQLMASSSSSSSSSMHHDNHASLKTSSLAASGGAPGCLFPGPPASFAREIAELLRWNNSHQAMASGDLRSSFQVHSNRSSGGSGGTAAGGGAGTTALNPSSRVGSVDELLGASAEANNELMQQAARSSWVSRVFGSCCGCCRGRTHPGGLEDDAGDRSDSVSSGGGKRNSSSRFRRPLGSVSTGAQLNLDRLSHEDIHRRVQEYVALLLGLVFDLRVVPDAHAFRALIQGAGSSSPQLFGASASSSRASLAKAALTVSAQSNVSANIQPSPLATKTLEFTWSSTLLPGQYFSISDATLELASVLVNEGLLLVELAHNLETRRREQLQVSPPSTPQMRQRVQLVNSSPPSAPSSGGNTVQAANPAQSSSPKSSHAGRSLHVPAAGASPAQSALVQAASAFDFVRTQLVPRLQATRGGNLFSQFPELSSEVLFALRFQCIAEQAELAIGELLEGALGTGAAGDGALSSVRVDLALPLAIVASGQYQAAHDGLAKFVAADERAAPQLVRWLAHLRARMAFTIALAYLLQSLKHASAERVGLAIKCADHALLLLDALAPADSSATQSQADGNSSKSKGLNNRRAAPSLIRQLDFGSTQSQPSSQQRSVQQQQQQQQQYQAQGLAAWQHLITLMRTELETNLVKWRRDNEFIFFQPVPPETPELEPPPMSALPAYIVVNVPVYNLPDPDERWFAPHVYSIFVDGSRVYFSPEARRAGSAASVTSSGSFLERFLRRSSSHGTRAKANPQSTRLAPR
ncbi:hypothetical protein CAOG_05686 [Capsaspora owczarzaki ATCC 30864]|uniref:BRO1 domain-containing protein n=1 Tax=Capsaspora owczarzaki (strain ATCC 30864) TaxID=595528 RepID=A0A0D2WSL9_CAPO3|nr:hypothetical protein CAOG_05686 [Capsaspora owczarzaki ATCC 30864]KJE95210.1 hypothetical protein CAOG_005686 [Capsaspora owczarzaki ATCC 30864]|eukprot:XP_004346359.1 hypothetical protein CAOG_05686 [Capsaspora owczarzaki ATCC 30864]